MQELSLVEMFGKFFCDKDEISSQDFKILPLVSQVAPSWEPLLEIETYPDTLSKNSFHGQQ